MNYKFIIHNFQDSLRPSPGEGESLLWYKKNQLTIVDRLSTIVN
jgi:hypothetical protein